MKEARGDTPMISMCMALIHWPSRSITTRTLRASSPLAGVKAFMCEEMTNKSTVETWESMRDFRAWFDAVGGSEWSLIRFERSEV